ncbi:MAG: hypothetical protein AAF585_22550 [Verrucomicrobiota bacterium]
MNTKIHHAFAISALIFSSCAFAQETDKPKQLTAAEKHEANIQIILDRQKDEVLKVYLKGSHGIYVNGKQISANALAAVAKRMSLKQSIVTTTPGVTAERVREVEGILRDDGVTKVKTEQQKVVSAKEASKATLAVIADRQKDNVLNVYLRNARTIHVNGKQISVGMLEKLARDLNANSAVISAEAAVHREREDEIKALIVTNGVKDVSFKAPK